MDIEIDFLWNFDLNDNKYHDFDENLNTGEALTINNHDYHIQGKSTKKRKGSAVFKFNKDNIKDFEKYCDNGFNGDIAEKKTEDDRTSIAQSNLGKKEGEGDDDNEVPPNSVRRTIKMPKKSQKSCGGDGEKKTAEKTGFWGGMQKILFCGFCIPVKR